MRKPTPPLDIEFRLPMALWSKYGHMAGHDGFTELTWSQLLRSHCAGPPGRIPPAELRGRVIGSWVRQGFAELRKVRRALILRLRPRTLEELAARLALLNSELRQLQNPLSGALARPENANDAAYARRIVAEAKALRAERADLLARRMDAATAKNTGSL